MPDDIAELMVSFNPDLNFKDATRNGNVFTWSDVTASVIQGQRVALRLSRIESSVDASFNLDVDGNGFNTLEDVVMIARYFLNLRGNALVTGQSSAAPATVQRNIEAGLTNPALDVDGNGFNTLEDIVMIARYFLNLRGNALVTGQSLAAPATVERNVAEMLE